MDTYFGYPFRYPPYPHPYISKMDIHVQAWISNMDIHFGYPFGYPPYPYPYISKSGTGYP